MRKHMHFPAVACRVIAMHRLATFPSEQSALSYARLVLSDRQRLAVHPCPSSWAVYRLEPRS